jgi:hypothetical protein
VRLVVPGPSAAGISSGSAAVGGGMAAGTMIAAAAPTAAATSLSYLIYRLAFWLASSTPPATAGQAASPPYACIRRRSAYMTSIMSRRAELARSLVDPVEPPIVPKLFPEA